METLPNFPSAGSKFEDYWQGDSGDMEHGRVSNCSDVSESTASSSQNLLTSSMVAGFYTYGLWQLRSLSPLPQPGLCRVLRKTSNHAGCQ